MIQLLLLLLVLSWFFYKKNESYVVINSNKKNIPREINAYQQKSKSDNYGFIPRSLYPEIVNICNKHSKKIIKEFKEQGGDKIFNGIPKKGGCRYIHLIKDNETQSAADQFPLIMKLIRKIPNLKHASLSCLTPKTRTKVHNKHENGLYRAHIPLQIPDGKCGICVEKQCRSWKLHNFLLVDENMMHQVWNNSNQNRVVLLLDVKQVDFKKD